MKVEFLHYREWQGQFHHPGWAVWPIARVSLQMLFRRRMFWVLYGMSMLIFLMFFFGGYLLDWMVSMVPSGPIQIGEFKPDPERLVRGLRRGIQILNGSHSTFAYFFLYQGAMVMVTLALTGTHLVGQDYVQGCIPFYLSKPISRWHYVAGKCLAVAFVVSLLTTVPALVLFLQNGLQEWQYFVDWQYFEKTGNGQGPAGLPLLLGILGYGLLLSFVLSLMLVAVASWARRTMPLVFVWTTIFLFFRQVSRILVNRLGYPEQWRLLDQWNNLRLLGCRILQIPFDKITPKPQPSIWEASLVLALACLVCIILLNLRTRAVEVVK